MNRPTMLLWRILLDVRSQSSDTIDRDFREIESRFEDEGESFLSITLPRLEKALLLGLSRGRLMPSDFVGFRRRSRSSSLPALLQGFFRRIFNDDGTLLAVPDSSAIFAIRQVARFYYKVEKPCSDQRIRAAYERYETNDASVHWHDHRCPSDASLWTSIVGYLWSDLEDFSRRLYCFEGIFGPGATAEKASRGGRHDIREWPGRAEGSFPSSFHAVSREDSPELSGISYLDLDSERPVKVVQVPKTLLTPRTISVEPSYMMLMQQSVAKPLMMYLEREYRYKCIRFTDQSVNQDMARIGSIDGDFATIDLKDASDLVSNDLVNEVFRKVAPSFLNYIQDCRSSTALMPDGRTLRLNKFASMGSALCFPIESMVFFTLCVFAHVKASGRSPSRALIDNFCKSIYIYGDDIIVRSSMAPVVMETLEAYGLKVNRDKSFVTGLFRESCGGDFYSGDNVTPVYVRQWDDTGLLQSPNVLAATVALSNNFYLKGMWNAAQYLRDLVERKSSRKAVRRLPVSRYPIGCLHWSSVFQSRDLRWSTRISGYTARGPKLRSKKEYDPSSSVSGALSRSFREKTHAESLFGGSDTVSRSRKTLGGFNFGLQPEKSLYDLIESYWGQSRLDRGRTLMEGSRDLCRQNCSLWACINGSNSKNARSHLREEVDIPYGSHLYEAKTIVLKSLAYSLRSLSVKNKSEWSDVARAYSLKHGWTATPAGLSW